MAQGRRRSKKEGWRLNHNRIHRLWREEGLRVYCRKKKRPLRGIGVAVGAMSAIRPNVIGPFASASTRRVMGGCTSSWTGSRSTPRVPGHRRRRLHRRRCRV